MAWHIWPVQAEQSQEREGKGLAVITIIGGSTVSERIVADTGGDSSQPEVQRSDTLPPYRFAPPREKLFNPCHQPVKLIVIEPGDIPGPQCLSLLLDIAAVVVGIK